MGKPDWGSLVPFITAVLGVDEFSMLCKFKRDYDPLFPFFYIFSWPVNKDLMTY